MTSSQTPLSGACQLGPERVAKALFRDLPEYVLGCKRAVRPDAPAKNAPVAQLDRALDYESRGQEFESLRARHFNETDQLSVQVNSESIRPNKTGLFIFALSRLFQ